MPIPLTSIGDTRLVHADTSKLIACALMPELDCADLSAKGSHSELFKTALIRRIKITALRVSERAVKF